MLIVALILGDIKIVAEFLNVGFGIEISALSLQVFELFFEPVYST
jgi:hypothetical protein